MRLVLAIASPYRVVIKQAARCAGWQQLDSESGCGGWPVHGRGVAFNQWFVHGLVRRDRGLDLCAVWAGSGSGDIKSVEYLTDDHCSVFGRSRLAQLELA